VIVIQRAYKTELDPNNKQRTLFVKCAGVARFVYNWGLADHEERYARGEKTNIYEQKRRFNALKDEHFPWIREVAYVIIQEAFSNLEAAYKNFYRRQKNGDKKPGYPKFKSRKNGIGSFRMRGSISIDEDRIKLPRIGWVRLKERGYLPTEGIKLLSVTISERTGRWFVSVQCEMEIDEQQNTGPVIGVDFGVKDLVVCSNGKRFNPPEELYGLDRTVIRLSRKLSRQRMGGKNREKTRRRIARIGARIANVRRQMTHDISDYLTAKTKSRVIGIEDLNVKGMMKNHNLARAIANVNFGELRRQIEYKARWRGSEVVVADRWYPSSKTCSHCGSIRDELKLSERIFRCPECGFEIDRDLNAAINLRNMAAKLAVTACGEERLQPETAAVLLNEAGTGRAA